MYRLGLSVVADGKPIFPGAIKEIPPETLVEEFKVETSTGENYEVVIDKEILHSTVRYDSKLTLTSATSIAITNIQQVTEVLTEIYASKESECITFYNQS